MSTCPSKKGMKEWETRASVQCWVSEQLGCVWMGMLKHSFLHFCRGSWLRSEVIHSSRGSLGLRPLTDNDRKGFGDWSRATNYNCTCSLLKCAQPGGRECWSPSCDSHANLRSCGLVSTPRRRHLLLIHRKTLYDLARPYLREAILKPSKLLLPLFCVNGCLLTDQDHGTWSCTGLAFICRGWARMSKEQPPSETFPFSHGSSTES